MISKKEIEQEMEQMRLKMYHAYNHDESQNNILQISKELDRLLNQLRGFDEQS